MPAKRKATKRPAKKRNAKMTLPKQWTTAKVRVNPRGKVQIKIAPGKVTVKPNRKRSATKRRRK